MRLLLDDSLPKPFSRLLPDHDVVTVADAGWSGLTNGRLLEVAQHQFDCLLTADQSLAYQQNLSRFAIAVVILRARTNRVADLAPLVPRLLEVLSSLRSGQCFVIEKPA